MFGYLLYYAYIIIPVVAGPVIYLIYYSKRPNRTHFIFSFVLMVITACIFLFDNPLAGREYAGLLFIFYFSFTFSPLNLLCGITAFIKSILHRRCFPGKLANILMINSLLFMIASICNIMMLFLTTFLQYWSDMLEPLFTGWICVFLPLSFISATIQLVVGYRENKKIKETFG